MARGRKNIKALQRIESMEADVDKWRTTLKGEEEDLSARTFCPRCLVQGRGEGMPCPVCKGVMVQVGTPPEQARRMAGMGSATSGYGGAPPTPATPPPVVRDISEGGGVDRSADGGTDGGAGAGSGVLAGGGPSPAAGARRDAGPMPPVRFCRNCGSRELERDGDGARVECAACGSVFRVTTGR